MAVGSHLGSQLGYLVRTMVPLPRWSSDAARTRVGKLRERRESAEITQERLASMARRSIATVRKIETGVVIEPGYFTVIALMSALFPKEFGM